MKNIHQLHHFWLAPALAIVSARGAIAQVIEITNLRVESTLQGLEILLESPSEKKIEFFQTVEDHRLILDINNAHLVGGNIEQEKPIAGVNFLQVTTPTENSIRVVIVGAIAAPEIAEVTQTEEQTSFNLPIPLVAAQTDRENLSFIDSTAEGLKDSNIQGNIEGFQVTSEIPGVTQTKEATNIAFLMPPVVAQIDTEAVSISEITNLRLNSTEEGLDILLEGNVEGNIEVLQTIEENRLIININNARLVREDFEQENPTEGVDFLQVTSPTENSIQAIVTGTLIAPEVSEVLQADELLSINLSVLRQETLVMVVTAQRFEETIQDVPLSITAFSEREIEDANIDSFESIAENTPNFSLFGEGSQTGFFNTYSIRGLSNSNFLNRDTVGFFIDDVPYDYAGF